MNNLADDPDYAAIKEELREALLAELRETKDPRVVGPDPEVFDSYLRYSRMRQFPKPIEGSTLK
jgi:uncharacterized sulfatase